MAVNYLFHYTHTSMNLRQHFLEIKRQFFPRWDRDNLWRIRTSSYRNVHGYCDIKRRVVEVVARYDNPDEQDCLLIHEICHAVASLGHGKKWFARMEKAASRAKQLGRHKLALILRNEINDYQNKPEGKEQAYQAIENMLIDNPSYTLLQVKRQIARDYGLLLSQVPKFLPRFQKVYREAKHLCL